MIHAINEKRVAEFGRLVGKANKQILEEVVTLFEEQCTPEQIEGKCQNGYPCLAVKDCFFTLKGWLETKKKSSESNSSVSVSHF
jgi:hypothetical protein